MERLYYSYGKWNLDNNKFFVGKSVNENNKVVGGLWACPYKKGYYSDWVLLTLIFPFLYKEHIAKGTLFTLKKNADVLTLDINNYKNFMKENVLDIDKVTEYDAIIFKQSLCENVKEFESYYIESIQILKFTAMERIEERAIDYNVMLTNENRDKALELAKRIASMVINSTNFNELNRIWEQL